MTNNTAAQQAELLSHEQISALKRDELRKYASALGIKNSSKLSRDNLTIVVLNEIAARTIVEQSTDENKTAKIRTSHANCDHASTKVARARCRRERAKNAK